MKAKRIRITQDLDIGSEHGITVGREFVVVKKPSHWKYNPAIVCVVSDVGINVGIYIRGFLSKAEVIEWEEE